MDVFHKSAGAVAAQRAADATSQADVQAAVEKVRIPIVAGADLHIFTAQSLMSMSTPTPLPPFTPPV